MKPQLAKSQLAILKHAPSIHRKYRPSSGNQSSFTNNSHSSTNHDHALALQRGGGGGGGGAGAGIGVSRAGATGFKPPSLLRRQSTRHKSFMDLDLPSMRPLRREPSMMELDPPSTLFAPAPIPSHFLPGPWAFFQAAEAQREQRQAQIEFLAKLQGLRLRDEQLFVNVMSGFAREYPVQFNQLTGLMRQMEIEMALGVDDKNLQQVEQRQLFQQQQQQQQLQYEQQLYQHDPLTWLKSMMVAGNTGKPFGKSSTLVGGRNDLKGTISGVLALAQTFGNQIYGSPGLPPPQQLFLQQQQEQQRQLEQQYWRQTGGRHPNHSNNHQDQRGGRGRGNEGGRHRGRGRGQQHNNNNHQGNGHFSSRPPPNLKRGKSFQQQQQTLQQLSAYQRQLYQQVQQMHSHTGGHQGRGRGGGLGGSVPMAHELMQYTAMAALAERTGNGHLQPGHTPQLGPSSPNSSPGSLSPLSPVGFGVAFGQPQPSMHTSQAQQLELAMHFNLNSQGSSRRSKYKPPH
ncbi:hypothetical protein BGZ94_002108 [Podila epigama]|nr:hypothetical protein BGZ94_002108 [Podila epigama]